MKFQMLKFQMLIRIKISRNSAFLGSDKPRILFFPLINVKMPTTVGILTFMSRKNFMLRRVEYEYSAQVKVCFFAILFTIHLQNDEWASSSSKTVGSVMETSEATGVQP